MDKKKQIDYVAKVWRFIGVEGLFLAGVHMTVFILLAMAINHYLLLIPTMVGTSVKLRLYSLTFLMPLAFASFNLYEILKFRKTE